MIIINTIVFVTILLIDIFVIAIIRYRSKINPQSLVRQQISPPQELRPAQVCRVYRKEMNIKEFSSTIIDLAIREILIIQKQQVSDTTYFYLILQDEDYNNNTDLMYYEKQLLDLLFKGISKMMKEDKAYTDFARSIHTSLVPDDYMEIDSQGRTMVNITSLGQKRVFLFGPSFTQRVYNIIEDSIQDYKHSNQGKSQQAVHFGISILIISVLPGFLSVVIPPITATVVSFSGIGVLLLSGVIPLHRYTAKGVETYEHISGFAHYIRSDKKDHLDLEQGEEYFFKYLPYVMILGREYVEQYMRAFQDMNIEKPLWYEDLDSSHFSLKEFQLSIDAIDQSIRKTFQSPMRSNQ